MRTPGVRLRRDARLALAVAALILVAGLSLARVLRPDPTGRGTHTQLGLRSCAFLDRTGRPCPTCGMTTSFAWMVRGRLVMAWRAHPAGCFLVPVCIGLIPWCLVTAFRGEPWGSRTVQEPLAVLVVATMALSLAAWIIRLLFGRV